MIYAIPTVDANLCNESFAVRVLTCDTITQTKQKIIDTIYRHVASTSRPALADVDLELRTPHSCAVMSDDDRLPTPTAGGQKGGEWRRLKMLSTYKVCNNAIIALIPRQRGSLTYQSE